MSLQIQALVRRQTTTIRAVISLVGPGVVFRAATTSAETTEPKSLRERVSKLVRVSVEAPSTFSISSNFALSSYWLRR